MRLPNAHSMICCGGRGTLGQRGLWGGRWTGELTFMVDGWKKRLREGVLEKEKEWELREW